MSKKIQELVYKLVFKKDKEAAEKIKKGAVKAGIKLNSTQKLYEAVAKGEISGFTVPAINIRTLTFDIARSILRQAIKNKVGAFIFELARSEISYTDQEMSEYVPVILAAAIAEGYKGYLFFQGDHYQIKAEKFFDPLKKKDEIESVKNLIKESIENGVYNIDIDCSTLVKLEEKELISQQKFNYEMTAKLAAYIRSLQPKRIAISIGGEIGEIGGRNSTPEDLKAFMEGFEKEAKKLKISPGLIKVAVQTGTKHGGLVGPNGELIKVKLDFETLKTLSFEARKYGMAGAVQHGASTLPEEYFHKFPETGAIEIHLATAYQNIVYDLMPENLREKIYQWLKKEQIKEKKPGQTEEQFLYETRKKALGTFKKEIWAMSEKIREKITEAIEERFVLLFEKLKVKDTTDLIDQYYSK